MTAASAASLLLLVACGSQLDPETVARAGGDSPQAGEPTAADPGADGTVPGTDTGTGTGTGSGTGSGTGTGTGSGTGSGTGTGTGTGTNTGTGGSSATGGIKAGSCAGFDNTQTGITKDKIVIANASDISGPVPGIFEAAQQATRAYAQYFNSTSSICGHKLEVKLLDTRADAGADQQAYTTACAEAFAAVGSMSAFDSGGAGAAADCGIPDMRSTAVTGQRTGCGNCFAAQAVVVHQIPSALPKYFLRTHKSATQHAALFYINAGAAVPNAQSYRKAYEKAGWKVDIFQGIDVSEFNFAPYVQQMKDKGIKLFSYLGPYQNTVKFQQAMKQQGFEPEVMFQDQTVYDARYIQQAGSLADNMYVYASTDLFDNFANKEMALYRSWLDQVSPGAVPNFYGLYAWSAARLFVEQAVKLGGKLTRASMVQALKGVRNWTGNGLHVPMQVGPKTTYNCLTMIQYTGGKWRKVSKVECGPLIETGVG